MKQCLITFALISTLITAACSTTSRTINADKTANKAKLVRKMTEVKPFVITSYSKNTRGDKPLRVYIEGDGFAWLSRTQPSRDPTPKNPLALKLAASDAQNYPNIAYIARPCQYTRINAPQTPQCAMKYWTGHRFAPEAIDSMGEVINTLKRSSDQSIELIGFSGGGNVAALLAAYRSDIVNLRTVAGNLDHKAHTNLHKVSPMPESLNAANYTQKLEHIPQIHYIGAKDNNVTPDIFKAYSARFTDTSCLTAHIIEGAGHIKKWQKLWPDLIKKTPSCKN